MSTQPHQQRTVTYSGHVQGVGFRYTVGAIADRFEVSGYVMNLPDGRVELVAEGTAAELDAFLADVQQRMGGHIAKSAVQTGPASGGFDGFAIRMY
jgi:acylphosphatase